jgi:hypothetical protein
MPHPRISLKGLKIAKFASQETLCYQVTVLLDGTPALLAQNDGHGGSDYFHPAPKATKEQRETILALATEWVQEHGPDWAREGQLHKSGEGALEMLVADLIADAEEEKRLRRWCKTQVVFSVQGTERGTYRTLKVKWTPAEAQRIRDHLKNKYPQGVTIVNERFA